MAHPAAKSGIVHNNNNNGAMAACNVHVLNALALVIPITLSHPKRKLTETHTKPGPVYFDMLCEIPRYSISRFK